MASKTSLTLLFFLPLSLSLTQPTSIFIDQVTEYSALPFCAERPLSTIVRDMARGCGDGSVLTSYDCFCTTSSSHFSSVISSVISQQCAATSPAAVTTALDVFHSYCELRAQRATATPTSSRADNSASAAATTSWTPIAPIPSKTSGASTKPGMDSLLLACEMLIPTLLGKTLRM